MKPLKEYIENRLKDVTEADPATDLSEWYLKGRKDAYEGLLDFIEMIENYDRESIEQIK